MSQETEIICQFTMDSFAYVKNFHVESVPEGTDAMMVYVKQGENNNATKLGIFSKEGDEKCNYLTMDPKETINFWIDMQSGGKAGKRKLENFSITVNFLDQDGKVIDRVETFKVNSYLQTDPPAKKARSMASKKSRSILVGPRHKAPPEKLPVYKYKRGEKQRRRRIHGRKGTIVRNTLAKIFNATRGIPVGELYDKVFQHDKLMGHLTKGVRKRFNRSSWSVDFVTPKDELIERLKENVGYAVDDVRKYMIYCSDHIDEECPESCNKSFVAYIWFHKMFGDDFRGQLMKEKGLQSHIELPPANRDRKWFLEFFLYVEKVPDSDMRRVVGAGYEYLF